MSRTARERRAGHEEAIAPEPPAVAPGVEAVPALGIPAILALQSAGGNRAVTALIARQGPGGIDAGVGTDAAAGTATPPPAAGMSTVKSGYDDAVARGDWDTAARVLAAMQPEPRCTRLDTADTARLVHLAQAAERLMLEALSDQLSAKLAEPAHAGAAQIVRDEAFATECAASNWPALVQTLGEYDDAGMDAKLGTLHLEQLNQVSAAANALRPSAERVWVAAERNRVRKLGEMYDDAWRHGRWEEAVTLVQAYNDIDLPVKLGELDQPGIDALCRQADLMPSYARVRQAAEPIRVRKLGEAYEAAVNAGTWPQAVLLLNAYNDADLVPKANMIKAKGAAAMIAAAAAATAQWADDNNRVRRALAFIQVEDQVGASARPAFPSAGTNLGPASDAGVAVPGGTVTAHAGVSPGGAGAADEYAFQYAGADAQETGWVQFIAREIERFDAPTGGTSLGYTSPGTLTHLGQPETISYGTPAVPDWHVDTFSDNLPFYEATTSSSPPAWALGAGQGAARRVQPSTPASGGTPAAPGETTMIDRPGNNPADVTSSFAPVVTGDGGSTAVKRVEARCRFAVYLVRGMNVLYKNTMLVTETYTAAPSAGGAPTRTNVPGPGGTAASFEPAHYQALIRRFPKFTYFPH